MVACVVVPLMLTHPVPVEGSPLLGGDLGVMVREGREAAGHVRAAAQQVETAAVRVGAAAQQGEVAGARVAEAGDELAKLFRATREQVESADPLLAVFVSLFAAALPGAIGYAMTQIVTGLIDRVLGKRK